VNTNLKLSSPERNCADIVVSLEKKPFSKETQVISIVIHGGAGTMSPGLYSPEDLRVYRKGLQDSLDGAFEILKKGGTALDAVCQAVVLMEDNPLFNAGRGSVLTSDGRVQMDAAVMCGASARCGGVTLIETVKNPVLAARKVMEETPHRLLGGKDAEDFARAQDLQVMDSEYFMTDTRRRQLQEAKKKKAIRLDHDGDESNTVGAVALDRAGNLAAATSTGGMTNKYPGRISDASIIGAGTFADNQTLAFSATGTGDVFIQNVSGFDAHALIAYKGLGLEESCKEVLEKLKRRGGEGGVIAVNRGGDVYLGFNAGGMFRGVRNDQGRNETEIF
jgi:beta-aspartyl-peptidase (threonine type)